MILLAAWQFKQVFRTYPQRFRRGAGARSDGTLLLEQGDPEAEQFSGSFRHTTVEDASELP
jgi:hypothetical protein